MSKANIAKAAGAIAATLLVGLEGYNAQGPYLDIAGVLTDCYGETEGVKRGVIRQKSECLRLLDAKVQGIAYYVLDNIKGEINANELAALISFAYNVGQTAFYKSTLRRLFNEGNHTAACNDMARWKYVTIAGVKVPSAGLMNRRAKEIALCLTPSNIMYSAAYSPSSSDWAGFTTAHQTMLIFYAEKMVSFRRPMPVLQKLLTGLPSSV